MVISHSLLACQGQHWNEENQKKDKKPSQPATVERRMAPFSRPLEEQTVGSAPEKVVVLVIERGERPGVREPYESAGEGLLTVQPLCLVWRPRSGATLPHCAAPASPPSPGGSSRLLAAPGALLKGPALHRALRTSPELFLLFYSTFPSFC